MKRVIPILFALVTLTACSTTYNYYTLSEPIRLYYSTSPMEDYITVEKGEEVLASRLQDNKYRIVNYKNFSGYSYYSGFYKGRKYHSKSFKKPMTDSEYAVYKSFKPKTNPTSSYKDSTRNNLYSTPSIKPSTGGPVQVKGYYRKDGTYVKPHTRAAPNRKN